MPLTSLCVILQYNQEIHYVEPCLNGTLVQADKTNKDVSLSHTFILSIPSLTVTNSLNHSLIHTLHSFTYIHSFTCLSTHTLPTDAVLFSSCFFLFLIHSRKAGRHAKSHALHFFLNMNNMRHSEKVTALFLLLFFCFCLLVAYNQIGRIPPPAVSESVCVLGYGTVLITRKLFFPPHSTSEHIWTGCSLKASGCWEML